MVRNLLLAGRRQHHQSHQVVDEREHDQAANRSGDGIANSTNSLIDLACSRL
jgi:hypothetical protein